MSNSVNSWKDAREGLDWDATSVSQMAVSAASHLTEERAEISERMVPSILEQARVVDDGGGIVLLDREPPP